MKKIILGLTLLILTLSFKASATNGDTVTVQTFTFGSPQNAWFVFPSDTVSFEKIQMLYTLKCNPNQFPNCGEWDYLTNTYLYKNTGLIDSTLCSQNLYSFNGASLPSYQYITHPAYNYIRYWDHFLVHSSTTSLTTYQVGNAATTASHPFGTSDVVSKSQYLWRASELTAAGMSAGDISGLRFYLQSTGTAMHKLAIKMKLVTADTLTAATTVSSGFTTVYTKNTSFSSIGWNSIQLTTPFNWNGTSNIIIEITYDNSLPGADNIIQSTPTSFKSGVTTAANDRVAAFHYNSFVDVPVNSEIAAIDSFVTVCYWSYGDPLYQPMDGTTFEAVDSAGNRILNAHAPWSDSKIYWDAGALGSAYDRISKTASAAQIKGQWNYYTFTKNCITNTMKIYINGVLFFNVAGKPKTMQGISKFRIGRGNWNGSLSYDGRMDDFAVFNIDLPAAAIQNNMKFRLDTSNPYYNNLVAYYNFNDGNYITAADGSPIAHAPATFQLGADNPLKPSSEVNFGYVESTLRPNVIFENGIYTSYMDSTLVVDSVTMPPVQVIIYDTLSQTQTPIDTLTVWPLYYSNYVFNSQGQATDSSLVSPDGNFIQATHYYYTYAPQVIRYEMARYITPYGNGLSLGNGWTWTFDVSDYRTLLADSVHLSAGNWQELLDLKFVMIKGTPPRKVISLQNLWNGNFDYGVPADPIDNHLQALTVSIPANAAMARWKSRVTGHGMDTPSNCAEFCPKSHYYKVNGVNRYSKQVWRDNCDYNPLFPQGGTWVYDRSNWCPGAEVWTYDWEISNWVTPGASFTLDHDVQAYNHTTGWDYYQIEDQLVSYGPANFTNDAAIEDIIAPSDNQMWSRKNAVCGNPIIVIKNTGATTMTSATITYGLTGCTPTTYNWTGSLAFMQSSTITLPNYNWIGGATQFYAYISTPNGATDQYAYNDTMKSVYSYPSVMPNSFIIELQTNNAPSENSYTLKDGSGNIILSKNGLSANTVYRDTVTLTDGCYKFELLDLGEDGLSWWANTAQGAGLIRFKDVNGTPIYSWNSDFGGQVYKQFIVGLTTVGLQDYILTDKNELNVFPNPSEGLVNIDYNLKSRSDATIEIFDMVGEKIYDKNTSMTTAGSLQIDLSKFSAGFYIVSLTSGAEKITKKLVIKK